MLTQAEINKYTNWYYILSEVAKEYSEKDSVGKLIKNIEEKIKNDN